MRHIHSICRLHTQKQTKRILSIFSSFVLVVFLFSSSSMASIDVNTGASLAPPQISGSFSVSVENAGSYVEPVNTFSDGTLAYYLVTQDPAKAVWTSVTYNGIDYPLTSVKVVADIDTIASIFTDNSTIFFDSGTYTDGNANAYDRYSKENLSMVGLYKDAAGEPTVILTKATRTDSGKVAIERNVVAYPNIYYENLIFDGQNNNMLEYYSTKPNKNRGEFFFYFSGRIAPWKGSAGFVMKDCIIQNVGNSTANDLNRNVAMNFYCSDGQHNFENVIIRNIKTLVGYGIISFNQSSGNYFKNIIIDGSQSSPSAMSVKIETKAAALPYNTIENVFAGNLTLIPSSPVSQLNYIYVQDYSYKGTVVPAGFRYAQYSTRNGGNYSSAVNIYADILPAAANKAILDLADNYWIVQSGAASTVEEQLGYIMTVLSRAASAGGSVPGANIKLVSNGGVLDSFSIPDMGNINVNMVAVSSAADLYSSSAFIPLAANASISLPSANSSGIRLYHIDFSSQANYTLQEVTEGIDPALTALLDPNETESIPGYPVYASYSPASPVPPRTSNASADTFINCRFTSLSSAIEIVIAPAAGTLEVGSSTTFSAQLSDTPANSYTGAGLTDSLKGTADDQTIYWFSSSPETVSIDMITGFATALLPGDVTITAKAADANNNGEIEKPFAAFRIQSVMPAPSITPASGVLSETRTPTPTQAAGSSTDVLNASRDTGSAKNNTAAAAKTGETTSLSMLLGSFVLFSAGVIPLLIVSSKRRQAK